ncbi:MAG: ABC transporter substrate-binding protein [Clostridia bacterium]|nr:ABC transporter substrate-binding protein [Clostridia bacterium]
MKKFFAMLLMIIILVTFLTFTGCQKDQLTEVRLCEVTHSIFYAPQYVAINKGFFEEEGIKIELSNGQGADKVMTALLSNQADIGFMGPEASIYVYNEGKEDYAVNFARLTQKDGSFLVGRKPEPDFKWENLKGKSIIGGRKGGVPEMTLEYVLKNHGLTPGEDVDVLTNVQFALMAGAFEGGTEDYVTLFEPVASQMEIENKGYIVASVGQAAGEVAYTVYSAKKSFIEKNRDLIQRFTNAIYKGQQWVENNSPENIAKTIQPSFPDSDLDLLTTVVKRYKEQDTWVKNPILTEESFYHLQEIIELAGELDNRAPFEKLVNNEFAERSIDLIK